MKEQVTSVSGREDSRHMKQQVERQYSQSVLGMTFINYSTSLKIDAELSHYT